MVRLPKLTREDIENGKKTLYHHVDCGHLSGLRISLTSEGRKNRHHFSVLGISSKEPISKGLAAVDASPFKTVFIVDEATGAVLYALSKNDDYVAAAKKKKPKPPTAPTIPPTLPSRCCQICASQGGYACDALSDGSCICYGATRETGGSGLGDELGTLAR